MILRCAYCGTQHKVPEFYLKFLNFFTDKYYFTCQNCLVLNCYGLYLRVYHDSTDKKERLSKKLLS